MNNPTTTRAVRCKVEGRADLHYAKPRGEPSQTCRERPLGEDAISPLRSPLHRSSAAALHAVPQLLCAARRSSLSPAACRTQPHTTPTARCKQWLRATSGSKLSASDFCGGCHAADDAARPAAPRRAPRRLLARVSSACSGRRAALRRRGHRLR
eukprot:scaffold53139_cov69-Phaeocystis_antarctica.AAC.5